MGGWVAGWLYVIFVILAAFVMVLSMTVSSSFRFGGLGDAHRACLCMGS